MRVEVLRDSIFYGIAKIRIGNDVKAVDARPSDVLALAVRTGSPIFVAEEVLTQAGQDRTEYEREMGKFTLGEGVDGILKEFDEMLKRIGKLQFPAAPPAGGEHTGPPK